MAEEAGKWWNGIAVGEKIIDSDIRKLCLMRQPHLHLGLPVTDLKLCP